MRLLLLVAAAGAGALTLSGCGWFGGGGGEAKLVCPASFIAPNTERMAVFKSASGTTLNNVSFGVAITGVQSKCARADHGLAVDTKVGFRLVSNDKTLRAGNFQYFVSLVDGYQNILTKRTYSIPFEFDARMHDMEKQDELVENLPLRDVSTGGNYAVVVGLQLTEAQLEFNRAAARGPSISLPPNVSVALPPRQNSASTP